MRRILSGKPMAHNGPLIVQTSEQPLVRISNTSDKASAVENVNTNY